MALSPEQFNQLKSNLLEQKGLKPDQFSQLRSSLQSQQAPKQTFLGKVGSFLGKQPKRSLDTLTGIGKGAVSTVRGASSLGERLLSGTLRTVLPKSAENFLGVRQAGEPTSAEKLIPESAVAPVGREQKAGFIAEQISEFLLPSSKVAKAEKGLKLIPRALTEAGVIGGQTALQQGEINNRVKTAAIFGFAFPIAGAGIKKAIGFLKPAGQKIQMSVIRPSAKDVKDGFKIETINKNNLGGTLEQTAVKTHVKINELAKTLNESVKAKNTTVNAQKVFQETAKKLERGKARAFGDVEANRRALSQLKNELNGFLDSKGNVSLIDAINIKRGAGTKGSWAFGRPEVDATAVERVYTNFYRQMKLATEKAGPSALREINKQISELIPVSNAVIRRMPVDQRSNIISLTSNIGLFSSIFDPRALGLVGANVLSKSGKFGQFLVNIAERFNAPVSSVGKRVLGF